MTETTTEIVEREAAEAELELAGELEPDADLEPEPEPEPEGEPEPEPEPEPAGAPASDADAERVLKRIERAADKYVRNVAELSGNAGLGLRECPLCPIPGFVPEQADPNPDPAVRLAVMSAIGEGLPPTYPPSPHLHMCEPCDGTGCLATGSRRAGFTDVECEVCMGRGWNDDRHAQAMNDVADTGAGIPLPAPAPGFGTTPASAYPSAVTQGGITFTLVPGGVPDPHGRLPGHPYWGQPIETGGL
jgi:hypothetical protein